MHANYQYAIDETQIRKTILLLLPPGAVIECRAAKAQLDGRDFVHKMAVGFFANADELAAQLRRVTSAEAIYINSNTLNPDLKGRSNVLGGGDGAKAGDVIRRTRLILDFDPKRTPGISSSDSEKQSARSWCQEISTWLEQWGWPKAVIGDSGNGYHANYRVDMPCDDASDAIIKEFLAAANAVLSTEQVIVDSTLHDRPRIIKLYGTLACKGANRPDLTRTHRWSGIFSAPAAAFNDLIVLRPEQIQQATEYLKAELAKRQPQPTPTPTAPATCTQASRSVPASASTSAPMPATAVTQADLTTINEVLRWIAPNDYGTWINVGLALHNTSTSLLPTWDAWSRGSTKYQQGECESKWSTFAGAGRDNRIGMGSLVHMAQQAGMPQQVPTQPTNTFAAQPIVRWMNDVQPEAIQWLWPGRIPLGAVTLIAGNAGDSKSTLTADLAAHITTGTPWPDCAATIRPSCVAIMSAEDGAANTIRPRLDVAGADVSKVALIDGLMEAGVRRPVTLEDLHVIRNVLATRSDIRVLVIDPILAYCGKADTHKSSDVRQLMFGLKELAEQTGIAVVCVAHPNKNQEATAINRISGSGAFVQAVRSLWYVVRDTDDDDVRLFLNGKSNLSRGSDGLRYRLVDTRHPTIDGSYAKLSWEGPVAMRADEFFATTKAPTATDAAVAWLVERLANGPVSVAQLKEEAKTKNLSWGGGVRRAKEQIKVVSVPGQHGWDSWALPTWKGATMMTPTATPTHVVNPQGRPFVSPPPGGFTPKLAG